MNRPCLIHFHADSGPLIELLPDRYKEGVLEDDGNGGAITLSVLHAFYIDFSPEILRTRINGDKLENPVDFPISAVSFIEWFYENTHQDRAGSGR